MKKYIVILASGNGTRMQSSLPKQYILLKNKPLLFYTIERVYDFNDSYNIIVVINKEHENLFRELRQKYSLKVPIKIVFGGNERYYSVKNALNSIEESDSLVAIHDGVRIFPTKQMFQRGFITAERYGNAICCIKVSDSIRIEDEKSNYAMDRNKVMLVQTPQFFITNKLKQAYSQNYDPRFTDDATIYETLGEKINIIEGSRENIKITYPFDLLFAEQILMQESNVNFATK